MKGGIGNLMKQAQQLQANVQKAQAEIAAMEITGESGGGMVKVTLNGRHEAKRVQIDPSVPMDDREMVEDLVAAIPDEWLPPDPVVGDAIAQRTAYVRYLLRRLEAPRSFAREAERVRPAA